MKKHGMLCGGILCMILTLMLMGTAAADTAYVDGGSADRVHMRAEPSRSGTSMGLYFTGTPVDRRADATDGWVSVVIGTQNGYMAADCLSDQPALSAQPIGIVENTHGDHVNLRQEPTMAAALEAVVDNGAEVVIFGETDTQWYYLTDGTHTGYMLANFVKLDGRTAVSDGTQSVGKPASGADPILGGTDTAYGMDALSAYMVVMQDGVAIVHGADGAQLTLSELVAGSSPVDAALHFTRYAIADVDGSGTPNAILELSMGQEVYAYLVLTCMNDQVYAYDMPYRGMQAIKQDGTFSYASGAADNGFGRFSADGGIVPDSWCESAADGLVRYFVHGAAADAEAFDAAVSEQAQKPDATWTDDPFTNGGIHG